MLAEEPAWGKSQLVPQPSLPLCCAETQHSISHRQEKTFKERKKKKKKSNKKTKKAREKKEGDSLSVSHAAAAMLTKEQYVAMVLMLT